MKTTRQWLESLDFPACCYCRVRRATQLEHVVPAAMRRRHHIDKDDERFHVPACADCNIRKATFKLYPRGFDVRILPGKGWFEWDGGLIPFLRAGNGSRSRRLLRIRQA